MLSVLCALQMRKSFNSKGGRRSGERNKLGVGGGIVELKIPNRKRGRWERVRLGGAVGSLVGKVAAIISRERGSQPHETSTENKHRNRKPEYKYKYMYTRGWNCSSRKVVAII